MALARSVALAALSLLAVACDWGDNLIVLTREAEVSDEFSGWDSQTWYTGLSLVESAEEPAVGNYVYLRVNIPIPGTYFPWVLAGLSAYDPDWRRRLKISITPFRANSLSRMDSVEVQVGPGRVPRWVSAEGPDRGLEFAELGEYFIIVEGIKDEVPASVVLDKFLLSNAPGYTPQGYAVYPDTVAIELPPAWAFGVLYGGNTDQAGTLARVDKLLDAGMPVSGYWIDAWFWDHAGRGAGPAGYIDFRGDREAYPDPAALFGQLEARGVKSGLWVWDALLEDGNEPVFAAFEAAEAFTGPPEAYPRGPHNATDSTRIGYIDFEIAPAADRWREQMRPLIEAGLDFLRLDRSADPYFLEAAFDATRARVAGSAGRGFILAGLSTADHPLLPRFPTRWVAEPAPTWSQADFPDPATGAGGGLREQVRLLADPRLAAYEIPFLAHAVRQGQDSIGEELYTQWAATALLNPISTFFDPSSDPALFGPFRYRPETVDAFRFYAQQKAQLFPYIYSLAHRARQTGVKPVRGLAEYPDQFLLGNALLVAPRLEAGSDRRAVYLPAGEWIDFYGREAYPGAATLTVVPPEGRLPLLVRSGSILPRRLDARGAGRGYTDSLRLEVYPGSVEAGQFELIEDDGVSLAYQDGRVARTTFSYRRQGSTLNLLSGASAGAFDGMPQGRWISWSVRLTTAPRSVRLDGQVLPESRWRYDTDTGELRIEVGFLDREARSVVEVAL